MTEETVFETMAKNIVGQCEVGNVNVLVFVGNGAQRQNLINAIAALQYSMKFEGFHKGGKFVIFGKTVNILNHKKGSVNGMKVKDARVYSLV